MAELAKKLHLKKGTTEHLAKAYSTTAEAGTEYITNKIDGVTAYIPIGATNDSRATMGRVKKPGGTEKAILTMGKPPYTKKQWTTPGTYTFTVPQGITTLRCNIVGGGGGGGGAIGIYATAKNGYGGNSGKYVKNHLISVLPNETITIVVGTGGKSYGNSNGQDGTSSSVGNLVCNGGKGGIGASADSPTNGQDSPFGKGGAAGNDTHNNGYDGVKGSGGGGAYAKPSFGNSSTPVGGYGGNGYISIEYGGDV